MKAKEESKIVFVRINIKKKFVGKDYDIFNSEIEKNGTGHWDNDDSNSLKKGDCVGFILGDPNIDKREAIVYWYKIVGIKPTSSRPEHWLRDIPYTSGNGTSSVKHRNVIVLEKNNNIPDKSFWHIIRQESKLGKDCKTWMPRNSKTKINKNVALKLGFKL